MATAEPTTPVTGMRPETHLTILAALNFVLAFGLLLMAAFMAWALGVGAGAVGMAGFADEWAPGGPIGWTSDIIRGLVWVMVAFFTIPAVLGIVGGVGLMGRKEYGRVLTFVFAVLAGVAGLGGNILLLAFPVYAFYALTRPEVVALFQPAPGAP